MTNTIKKLSISIPAISENIRIVESFIDNTRDKFQLDDEIYGNIMIAVTEAVHNSIKHGSKNDATKNVDLTLLFEKNLVKFIIKDYGAGFNYQSLPDPTSSENINKTHGRGVFLMHNLADKVVFKEKGQEVELFFYTTS